MILVDTNILVAVANDRDNHHQAARELLETTADDLLVPSTVIAEVCYLLSQRAGLPPRSSSSGPSVPASYDSSS